MSDTTHHQKKNETKKAQDNLDKGYWYLAYPEFWNIFENMPRDTHILDVGCGSGIVADTLSGRGFNHIVTSDIFDYRTYERVKKMPFAAVNLNFDTLPFADATYDVVIAANLIEHLENPFFFLRECRRVLKPGGVLVLTMYVGWNWMSRFLFLRTARVEGFHNPKAHISFLPPNIFRYATRGFSLKSVFYERRTTFYIFGYAIPWRFPRTVRWSPQAGFVFEKMTHDQS